MIITEIVIINGKEFTHNYSDSNKYVVKDGIQYEEAYDPAELNRTYTEGNDILIEEPTEDDFAQVGRIMMGYENNR